MNATKFTKGPWKTEVLGRTLRVTRSVFDHDNDDIAVLRDFEDPEEQANAALIAAAPEVYAALAECVAELEAYDAPSDPMDSHNVRLAKARAALAKAVLP